MTSIVEDQIEATILSFATEEREAVRTALQALREAGAIGMSASLWAARTSTETTLSFVEKVAAAFSFCIWSDHQNVFVFGDSGDEPQDVLTDLDVAADFAAFSHTRVVTRVYDVMEKGPFGFDDIVALIMEHGFDPCEAAVLADTLFDQFRVVGEGDGMYRLPFRAEIRSGFQILIDTLENAVKNAR